MQANNSSSSTTTTALPSSSATISPSSSGTVHSDQALLRSSSATSSVFFCFGGSSHDSADTPNKIVFEHGSPTASDLAAALKKLFRIPDNLTLRIGNNYYNDDSLVPVPVNDRNNVVWVKAIEPSHSAPAQEIEAWLQKESIDAETVRLFKEHKVTPEILRTMKDEQLVKLGINNWSIRQQILDAIKKYEVQPLPRAPAIPLAHDIISIATVVSEITEQEGNKRKRESIEPTDPNAKESPAGGKRKVGRVKRIKTKIKFKDIDALVNNERMPVNVGMSVYCGSIAPNSGCNGIGTIVQHKDKAVIQYTVNDETRYGSIAKFYKDVTGEALQEKGTSWGNFFFKNNTNGQTYSLEGLKYLCVGPKKSVSAFLYFSNEARIKYKELKPDAFARLAGELWKKLTHEEKQPYRVLEEQDKERFNRERLEWESMVEKHAQPQVHISLPLPSILQQQIEQPPVSQPQQVVTVAPVIIPEAQQTTTTTTTTVPATQTSAPAEHV